MSDLSAIATEVQERISAFAADLPAPHAAEALDALHDRLLILQSVRSYLSGHVAALYLDLMTQQKELARLRLVLEVAEAEVVGKLRLRDFDSAKTQQGKLLAATLDEVVAVRRAEVRVADTRGVLDFVREHLRELERQSHDLNLRVRLLNLDS